MHIVRRLKTNWWFPAYKITFVFIIKATHVSLTQLYTALLFFQTEIYIHTCKYVSPSWLSWRKAWGDWERSCMDLLKLTWLYCSWDAMKTTIVWLQCMLPWWQITTAGVKCKPFLLRTMSRKCNICRVIYAICIY